MIFSLFWRGRLFEGAFILKSEILGGRLFEEIRYTERYFRPCLVQKTYLTMSVILS